MRKRIFKKLRLSKETLQILDSKGLRAAAAADPIPIGPTLWGDACAPSDFTCAWGPCPVATGSGRGCSC